MRVEAILADDHRIFREGLLSLLEKHETIHVVGQAENGREAVQLACELRPDIAIMDVDMPELNGIDATSRIRKRSPETRVIALSMYSDRRFVSGMFRAGASAYLLKDGAYDELLTAVDYVLENRKYVTPAIAGRFVPQLLDQVREPECESDILTDREREIVQLIAEGKRTKDIASLLVISVKTVETHRKNVLNKLQLSTAADLIRFAIREGLVSLQRPPGPTARPRRK